MSVITPHIAIQLHSNLDLTVISVQIMDSAVSCLKAGVSCSDPVHHFTVNVLLIMEIDYGDQLTPGATIKGL